LMMKGRRDERRGNQKWESMAATHMENGTDMNFGELTRALFKHLEKLDGVKIFLEHEVNFIERRKSDQHWEVEAKNLNDGTLRTIESRFVFIGAGGGSLPLLEDADIPEAKGYGGFPVSGQWLICKNEELIKQHAAKVYGKAEVGAPPMSVPHLDTRIINGKKELLFGPYAGFSTKFLKHGSLMDLPSSLQVTNIIPMISAGWHNMPLTKYLIEQVRQTPEERLAALKKFVPTARMEDWVLEEAGQRVQVIKKDRDHGGVLEFGTEVVASADGTIAALLGASPGASTSVSIMLDVLTKCFPTLMKSDAWHKKLKEIIPSFGQSLANDPQLCKATRDRSDTILGIKEQTATGN
jgi:malate dehydrogenase (quinone)